MTSVNERLNEVLKFAEAYNKVSGKKITQLEALKAYLAMERAV